MGEIVTQEQCATLLETVSAIMDEGFDIVSAQLSDISEKLSGTSEKLSGTSEKLDHMNDELEHMDSMLGSICNMQSREIHERDYGRECSCHSFQFK